MKTILASISRISKINSFRYLEGTNLAYFTKFKKTDVSFKLYNISFFILAKIEDFSEYETICFIMRRIENFESKLLDGSEQKYQG